MAILDVLSSVFASTWSFLSGIQVPGIGITFASWFLALALICVTVAAVQYAFGLGGKGSGYRSGRSGKKYISERRKDDEK